MQSTKPAATLTDVKNKTGDVFALAEKNGAVVITSYNKPKYVICKYSLFEELQQSEPEEATKTAEVKVEITTPEPVVIAAPEVPVEMPAQTVVPVVVQATEPAKTEQKKEEAKAEVKPTVKVNPKDLEWWDRRSNREKNWVKSVKSLL